MKQWLRLLRPGDWLVAALGLGAVLAVSPVPGGQPSNAVLIRAGGAVFRQATDLRARAAGDDRGTYRQPQGAY